MTRDPYADHDIRKVVHTDGSEIDRLKASNVELLAALNRLISAADALADEANSASADLALKDAREAVAKAEGRI